MLWEMNNHLLMTSFAFICCFSFICGWVADRIIGYSGFSVIGNWLLLLLGAYVGLLCYNLLGFRFRWDTNFTLMLALGSSLGMFLFMLTVKKVFSI